MSERSIEELLTGGDPRKLQNVDEVTELALGDPHRLEELYRAVFSDDEIVRMRASDCLEKVCARQPELLEPYVERLLTEMAAVDQPSVQWHLAQVLGRVTLTDEERLGAVAILVRNLDTYDDWIVTNLTLQALADLTRADEGLRPTLLEQLHRYQDSGYKSVASRVRKLSAEFG